MKQARKQPTGKITEHFTWEEFFKIRSAVRNRLTGQTLDWWLHPPIEHLENIKRLATYVLEPLRLVAECPISISVGGGYRPLLVNNYCGSKTDASRHRTGGAADVSVKGIPKNYDNVGLSTSSGNGRLWLTIVNDILRPKPLMPIAEVVHSSGRWLYPGFIHLAVREHGKDTYGVRALKRDNPYRRLVKYDSGRKFLAEAKKHVKDDSYLVQANMKLQGTLLA